MSKQSLSKIKQRIFFDKNVVVFFLLILIFGFLIRIYHLTILPVFADEAIYIRWSQVMAAESTLRFLPLTDGKQPLFMWILMFIVRRFSDPLFISRLLSIISGMGSIIGIFVLTEILFKNHKISLFSCFLWVISPISFFFDRMALVDSMLTMFGVWTLVFAVLTAKYKRLDTAMIAGFTLGFAFLTKSPALFFAILIPSTWIYIRSKSDFLKLVLLTLVTYVIGYGMYNILRLGPDFSQIAIRNLDYVFPISHVWTNPKDPFVFHIAQIFGDWFIKMGPITIVPLGLLGLLVGFKQFWREKALLFVWFFVPLLITSEYSKTFTIRYILFSLPFLYILSSLSILQTKSKLLKWFVPLLIFISIIQSSLFIKDLLFNPEQANLPSSERSGYLEEWSAGTGIREVSVYLKSLTDNKINVGTEGFFGTLPDGLQMYMNNNKNVNVFGVGLNFNDVPEKLKNSREAGDETYFVINSSRIQIKPEDYERKGLKLIQKFPKAIRKETQTREYVMNGPQDFLLFFKVVEPINKVIN